MLSEYDSHTDLALESQQSDWASLSGVDSNVETIGEMTVTRIRVRSEAAAERLGKGVGSYITIEAPGLRGRDPQLQEQVTTCFRDELKRLIIDAAGRMPVGVLVVGLGNDRVTPDSLGPLVVEQIFVTRHFFETQTVAMPEGMNRVSAVAPGVLGTTGIETGEVVRGIIEHVKPELVIAVDALASRSLDRLHTTIQMADTGIRPGSGIGNHRKALNLETLGVPVIAVGVPTVVYASSIVNHCIQLMALHDKQSEWLPGLSRWSELDEPQRLSIVRQVLQPLGHDLLVTPKDIDRFTDDIAELIADGINGAMHDYQH